eukprot:2238423-Rhodomonas_salina.1
MDRSGRRASGASGESGRGDRRARESHACSNAGRCEGPDTWLLEAVGADVEACDDADDVLEREKRGG